MGHLRLCWAMAWRSPWRTAATVLSIFFAFVLFALLQAVSAGFSLGVDAAGANRILVTHRNGLANPMPIAHEQQLQGLLDWEHLTPVVWLGFTYQRPENAVPGLAVKEVWHGFEADPRIEADVDLRAAMGQKPNGLVVGVDQMRAQGWKVGDRIPLQSLWTHADGNPTWEFEIVGTYRSVESVVGSGVPALNAFANYDYIEAGRKYQGLVSFFVGSLPDAKQVPHAVREIDLHFRNSAAPTKSQSEAEFSRSFARQIGDVGLMLSAVLGAVCFTLLLVAGNTMMQAYNERIPELGVMKSLGFSDRHLAVLVLAESVSLCVGAAMAAMGLMWLLAPHIQQLLITLLPGFRLGTEAVGSGALLAVFIGVVAALVPVVKVSRLSIREALTREA